MVVPLCEEVQQNDRGRQHGCKEASQDDSPKQSAREAFRARTVKYGEQLSGLIRHTRKRDAAPERFKGHFTAACAP
jgi:hypothetical protein